MYTQKSFILKPADAKKNWYLIDGSDQIVGRLASKVANVLRGKDNPQYTPHTDSGDFVVVINAEKLKFTGNKLDNKKYYRHTGYVGSLKEEKAGDLLERDPQKVLMNAVKGMLPKNRLGREQLTKLRVYAGESHSHEAQKPKKIDI